MNCSQARALLAIYREQKEDQANTTDTTELEVHRTHCATCREASAQYTFVGERMRSLPPVEPAVDAHKKLMQALAAEHMIFMQRTPSAAAATPIPPFLAPYLKDLILKEPETKTLAAFVSAETGPLPIVRPLKHKRPHPLHLNHFATLGLAASFLLVVMLGGLTSLLLLTRQGSSLPTLGRTTTSIHSVQISTSEPYTTTAAYPYVASAIANGDTIYYTTYNETRSNWMLEQFDSKKNTTTSLLDTAGSNPLILQGSSKDWLLWLQFDLPTQPDAKRQTSDTDSSQNRPWKLHARALGTGADAAVNISDTILYSDTFNPGSVPAWVKTPIQGFNLTQSTLLLTMIDGKGVSHLLSYQLDKSKTKQAAPAELASANNGHILSSPTSNPSGTYIYWSDEWWLANENRLASNIWTQQVGEAAPERQGRWAAHMQTYTYPFRSDTHAFEPQLVDDTLFFLSTPGAVVNGTVNKETPTATVPPATPINTTSWLGGAVKYDPSVYTAQIDEKIAGKLQTYTANGSFPLATAIDDNKIASSLQAGKRFLLWQNSQNTFEMYDVETKSTVTIDADTVARDAAFLSVNGDTAVWIVNSKGTVQGDQGNQVSPTIKINTFKWPRQIKGS